MQNYNPNMLRLTANQQPCESYDDRKKGIIMMNKLMNVFAANNETKAANGRTLTGTVQLQMQAAEIKKSVIAQLEEAMNGEQAEELEAAMLKAQSDNNAMDELVQRFTDIGSADVDWLRGNAEADKMLASVQSKRSRLKTKEATYDVFVQMVEASISEQLIRVATGKTKGNGGATRVRGSVEYTEEQLAAYAEDQDALKREIRNIQSKKSIMKSKAGFSEQDAYWIKLLDAEAQLKALRVGTTSKTVVVQPDPIREQLKDMIGDTDISKMNKADMAALLANIVGIAQ